MLTNMSQQSNVPPPINNITTSPQTKRNTKNLSLQLNNSNHASAMPIFPTSPLPSSPTTHGNMSHGSSPPEMTLYRHPSLNRANSVKPQQQPLLKRRTTLSLSIPDEGTRPQNKTNTNNNTGISIPSCSTSPSSPLVPSTPKEHYMMGFPISTTSTQTIEFSRSSSTSQPASETEKDTLQTQTLVQDLSHMSISADNEIYNLDCYPDGPVCVKDPNLFLYSEPTLQEIEQFDLVVNVAKECPPPFPYDSPLPTTGVLELQHGKTKYVYVPWTHTSKLCLDLPQLTNLIQRFLETPHTRILIHCQCGVSRSASLIIALFMKLRTENLNDSYNVLKEKADKISPNMSLIFQLMEWGEILGVNEPVGTPTTIEGKTPENDDDDNE
ncbi:hypothetical protein WICPIJ_004965 [Wickerhamomyces pijperi]|uniref:protein-tyrosine-phosphatase n=1 Tax=Wickerhamomyces pijperi TaxID=599730 RepID=A0A9P8TLJ8_WICPI|nr:hypothetical protein WICPIJ_004965 [Wickerhamomyces pijperi]